jgi:hypothetical protein
VVVQMQILNKERNRNITDEGIKNMVQMKYLHFRNTKITDEGIKN